MNSRNSDNIEQDYKKNLTKALKNQANLNKQLKQVMHEKSAYLQHINQLGIEKSNLLQHIKELNAHIASLNAHAEQLELELIEARKRIFAFEQQEVTPPVQENKQTQTETEKTPPQIPEKTEANVTPVESSYIWRLFGYKNQEAKPVPAPNHQTPLVDLTHANVQLAMAEKSHRR